MILKASERGGAKQLGSYLLRPENEQVEVHEVRGYMASDLRGAMAEADAIARGTRCENHLFSASLNPPQSEAVSVAAFVQAADRIEERLGLAGHPRVIVFHENDGRRHAHVVWSRIDADTMTAKNLSHFKLKLREVSKSLYLEHGWQMPKGLADFRERSPANFSFADWQHAKRLGQDPNLMKNLVRECWAMSDSKASFAAALQSRSLGLAAGEGGRYVVVAHDGTVRAIPRLISKKSKEVAARLGEASELPAVKVVREQMARTVGPRLRSLIAEARSVRGDALRPLHERRSRMQDHHRTERQRLDSKQAERTQSEAKARAARLRHGVLGAWDRIMGKHRQTAMQNDAEALASMRRDRAQRDDLVAAQLRERRGLQADLMSVRRRHAATILGLHRDLAGVEPVMPVASRDMARTSEAFRRAARGSERGVTPDRPRAARRGRDLGRDGPGLG